MAFVHEIDKEGRAPALEARAVSVWYGSTQAVKEIDLVVPRNRVVALIGPSGCGKSTLLRCFNRMNDLVLGAKVTGEVLFHGQNLYDTGVDPVEVRRRIGMVFQKPNPFPKSIYDNTAFGPRINGYDGSLDEIVEQSLKQAALWEEVRDRLDDSAYALSGGQQQRLCIARTLAVTPEIVLMDEPASALDPIATQKIEELMYELKRDYTIVIVTHNMQQAARISDYTAFLYMGELIEYGPTDVIFTNPHEERTEAYVTGRFGSMPDPQKGRRNFRDEMDELQGLLLEMGGVVEELVRRAVSAFLERDSSMVDWAKREDDRIDELEVEIDEAGLELLALFQPMAGDLRHIISGLKVSSDLERVADHGVNIAKAAGRIAGMPGMPAVPQLTEIAEISRSMLADCLACYISRDAKAARAVLARDVKVDRLRRSLFRILLTHMLEDPRRISPSLEVLLVAQNLERIADLSTNIAEDVVFIVEGRTIKHHHEGRPLAEDDEAV